MIPGQKQKFMQVKHKLDQYRLPTTFPYEATNIIHKLIARIQQKDSQLTQRTRSSYQSIPLSPKNHSNSQLASFNHTQVTKALEDKILKLLRENSQLSGQLTEAKEEIQMLKECKELQLKCDSLQYKSANKQSNQVTGHKSEVQILRNGFQIMKAREIELFEQVTQVKFKYNQLMDLLHEDPHTQKIYIKRLVKHKKYSLTTESLQQKQKASLSHKHFKSETVYTTEPQKYLTNEINQLQGENYKLFCLNRTLKHKLENRELLILKLQNQLIDQFNVQGLVNVYQLQQKDAQIITLKNQVEILLEKLYTISPNGNNDSFSPNNNDINHYQMEQKSKEHARHRSKEKTEYLKIEQSHHNNREKTLEKKKQTNQNPDKTNKSPKSPIHINLIKSPPKAPQKTNQDSKNRALSKQRPSVKSPSVKDSTQTLKQQNTKLKLQNAKLEQQIQQIKTQLKSQLKSQPSQQHTKDNKMPNKPKTLQQYEDEIEKLKTELNEKDGAVRKMELRWKNVQEQNRILIEELSDKRRYADQILNNSKIKNQDNPAVNKSQQKTHNATHVINNNSGRVNHNPTNAQLPPTSPRNSNLPKSNTNLPKSNSKSPFTKKPPRTKSPHQSIKHTQAIKTINLQSTNIQTTNTNLLSTNAQSTQQNSNNTQSRPHYSPSKYAKSQNNPLGNKVYSEKINIDLGSEENQSSREYASNIHSGISTEGNERESKKSEKVRLPDIQEEDSLEKSHHSEEEGRSRQRDNYNSRNSYNMPGIKISIKHNNQSIEQKYYENASNASLNNSGAISNPKKPTTSQKSEHFQQQKRHLSQIQMQNYQSHHPVFTNDHGNFLQVDDSDKDSVFSMRKEIDQLKIENRKETKTKKKLQKTLQQIQHEKDKLEDRILMLEAQIDQLQQNSHHPKETSHKEQYSPEAFLANTAELDRKLQLKIKQQGERIVELEQQNVQTQLQIRDRDSKIANLSLKIQSLSAKLSQLTSHINNLDEENMQLKKERQKLLVLQQYGQNPTDSAYKTLKKDELNTSQQNPASHLQGSNQVLWLKKQINTLKSKIQKYNDTVNELNDYINMHRQEKEKLSLQKLNLQKQNDYLKQKLLQLQRALTIQAQQMKRYRDTFQI